MQTESLHMHKPFLADNVADRKSFNIQTMMKYVFQFLNVIEVQVVMRVCKAWRKIIENEPDVYRIVNLSNLSFKVNTLNLMKVLQTSKNIQKLYLPYNSSQTDTS